MSYATLSQLRTQMDKTGTTGAGSDTALQLLLDAVSSMIDGFCNRPEGFVAISTATPRYYPGSGKPFLRIDECVTVTAVAVKDSPSDDEDSYVSWTVGVVGTTVGADVFPATGDPRYPIYHRTPYTLLIVGANGDYPYFPSSKFTTRGGFRPSTDVSRSLPVAKVTSKWGYATTAPKQVVEATIIQSARMFKRGESAWADTLASGDFGMLLYRQKLDPDIALMLVESRLVRPAIGRR